MPRAIALFEKEGDALVNRFEFLHDDVEFFLSILDHPDDDPLLYDVYRVDNEINKKIFEKFGIMVDIEKFDCSIEYYE
ncbi:DUF7683 domain-containing protein [Phyllobacterium endophyticum]|uniref:DUF7683 domain-containing protein n=1 Tax=Phyllobacterium endophyticum TaxID=1149773 RepID=A0A2P7B247_9HYPH|nr:hypothetical protein [Phyllobacterium endophyticum]MBB3238118.1 hypothetical protein [Phyllobacterium endophyticum]PSH60524.1 hypothetical protein CU100_07595 [Phyllobacterium endophyticum]TYR42701.1 hypothetical protein FY050_16130 [Phyllobacterium endophyticum]